MNIPFSESDHRWLRMREDEGTVYYEGSATGSDWTILASAPTSSDWSAVSVNVTAGTLGTVAADHEMSIAGVNTLP